MQIFPQHILSISSSRVICSDKPFTTSPGKVQNCLPSFLTFVHLKFMISYCICGAANSCELLNVRKPKIIIICFICPPGTLLNTISLANHSLLYIHMIEFIYIIHKFIYVMPLLLAVIYLILFIVFSSISRWCVCYVYFWVSIYLTILLVCEESKFQLKNISISTNDWILYYYILTLTSLHMNISLL